MYYIVRCPHCEHADIEKLEHKLATFKCLNCDYEFFDTEAIFNEIDTYEINKRINVENVKVKHLKGKITKIIR